MRVGHQFIVRCLQLEDVENGPVRAGGDARADDIDPEAGHGAGNAREQPRIIDRQQCQFGHLALGDLPEIGQKRDIHVAERAAETGMPDMHVGVESGPVVAGKPGGVVGEFLVTP